MTQAYEEHRELREAYQYARAELRVLRQAYVNAFSEVFDPINQNKLAMSAETIRSINVFSATFKRYVWTCYQGFDGRKLQTTDIDSEETQKFNSVILSQIYHLALQMFEYTRDLLARTAPY
jgi:hypothetical protein